jgi:hypothetical protein
LLATISGIAVITRLDAIYTTLVEMSSENIGAKLRFAKEVGINGRNL